MNKYKKINQLLTAGNKESSSSESNRFGLRKKEELYRVVDILLILLFPEDLSKNRFNRKRLKLLPLIKRLSCTLTYFSTQLLISTENWNKKRAKQKAKDITEKLIDALPSIQEMLKKDIACAYEGDPAAKTLQEIILSYPFIEAIATHRIAHFLYKEGLPIIPRMMSEKAHSKTGIDIHPGAEIEAGFFIDHGTGVVIGETTRIGKNVKIYQGVTLGALSPFDKKGEPLRHSKRHPDIEDDVIIYANATILGGKTVIGKGAIIGGNCWITKSIPPKAVVYHNNEIKILER